MVANLPLMRPKRKSHLWQWQEKCKSGTEKCAKCGSTERLTVDHLVPAFLLKEFMVMEEYDIAYDFEENFEIVCFYCNRMKGARIDPRNPKVFQILEEVIRRAKEIHLKK